MTKLYSGLLVCSSCTLAAAASLTLAWNSSSDTSIVGYHVYYGLTSGVYAASIDAGNALSVTVSNLLPSKRYYFAATDYRAGGLESLYSPEVSAVTPLPVALPFWYGFGTDGKLLQISNAVSSSSPYWWLASGGYLGLSNGVGMTASGTTTFQLFFRALTIENFSEEIYVMKTADNIVNVTNRYPYNGISLFMRYVDANNHYYAGIRADGYAVIKKRTKGVYRQLAYTRVFPGTWNITNNPTLIPSGVWIGLRSVITNHVSGNPNISFYLDQGRTGAWTNVTTVVDDPALYGAPLSTNGMCGLRSDFIDMDIDDFRLSAIAVPTNAVPAAAAAFVETPLPPQLGITGLGSDGMFLLSVSGLRGVTYIIQKTSDFVVWTNLATNTITVDSGFTYTDRCTDTRGFYRVLEADSTVDR